MVATDINYKHLEPLDITLPSNLNYIKNWIGIKKGKKECDKNCHDCKDNSCLINFHLQEKQNE